MSTKKDELMQTETENIIDELIENSKFDIDEEVVAENATYYYYEHKNMASIYNMSLNEYVHDVLDYDEDIYNLCYEESLHEIQRHLVIGRYAKKRNFVIMAEDINCYITSNNLERSKISDEQFHYIKYNIIEEKVFADIVDTYIISRKDKL